MIEGCLGRIILWEMGIAQTRRGEPFWASMSADMLE